jgi:hypothetical protein
MKALSIASRRLPIPNLHANTCSKTRRNGRERERERSGRDLGIVELL